MTRSYFIALNLPNTPNYSMKKYFQNILFVLLCLFLSVSGTAQVITTVAGDGGLGYSGDGGQATNAAIWVPYGVAVDGRGNIYFSDTYNNRIRMVSNTGYISTLGGNGTAGFTGNNGPAIFAEINSPGGLAADVAGNVYFSEAGTNCIRKISITGTISIFAGTGTAGFSGDGGPATAAELNNPVGMTIDAQNNIYIADEYNERVRLVDGHGIIRTIAGNGTEGFSGDGGQAIDCELDYPVAVAVDSNTNIYVVDYYNNRVRKIDTTGTISTIAGNGTTGYSGDGGPATSAALFEPMGVAIDRFGNVHIADMHNNCIRRVNTDGVITTYAGNNTPGFDGNNGPATAAQLYYPVALSMDRDGSLYIADYFNYRIRKVSIVSSAISNLFAPDINIYPNPSSGVFNVEIPGTGRAVVTITNTEGKAILTKVTDPSRGGVLPVDLRKFGAGMFFIVVTTDGYLYKGKIVSW